MEPSRQFGALADPTRRAIFEALREGPRAVGELADPMPVSRPAVSQHLKVLTEAGLVTARADGTRRIYSLDPAGVAALRRWIEEMWDDVLDHFEDTARREAGP